jgi:gamma-glutamyltranspeptidase/glutathione hydrolase
VILNVIDQGMSLPEAVAAPRVHHQALPDLIRHERGGLAPAAVEALRQFGHRVEERGGTSGIVAAIGRAPNGGWIGVADPRYAGGAAGY